MQEIIRMLQEKRYKWLELKVTYVGVKQKCLIVKSESRKKNYLQKLDNKLKR